MYKLCIIISLLSVALTARGQEVNGVKFKIVWMAPDTVYIDRSLQPFADTLNREYLETYRKNSKRSDNFFKAVDPSPKYYNLLPFYSAKALQLYFRNRIAGCEMVNNSNNNFSKIASSFNADFIIQFKNIHTEWEGGDIVLKFRTILYSNKSHKIILNTDSIGHTGSTGDMWSCSNPLSCLIINAVESSNNQLIKILRLQKSR